MDGGIATHRADWKEIGLELRRHGWTQGRVAETLNVPRTTVAKWFSGSEPGYASGVRLIRLHNLVVMFRAPAGPQWRAMNHL